MNEVHMLSHDVMMSPITQLPDCPLNYHKTARMFPINLSKTKLTAKKSATANDDDDDADDNFGKNDIQFVIV